MEFFSLFILWWLELHTISAMVDYQSIQEGWLGEATLFPAEHNGNLNFDDLFNTSKAQDEGLLSDQWDGLQWLEENVKFTLDDERNCLSFPPDETDALINECMKAYPFLFDCVPEASAMQADETKNEINPDNSLPSNPSSPDGGYESTYLTSSPCYEPISEAGSPASSVSDIPVDGTVYGFCLSPSAASDTSSNSPAVVSVTICNDTSEQPVDSEVMTIEEVVSSVKERKYLAAGKSEVPKVQVSLKDAFHPYSRTKARSKRRSKSSYDPFERKKVQNKEAAARYRNKKKEEEKLISDQVEQLQAQQDKLKTKHDDILSEIKYLKSLMREMFQKKGLL